MAFGHARLLDPRTRLTITPAKTARNPPLKVRQPKKLLRDPAGIVVITSLKGRTAIPAPSSFNVRKPSPTSPRPS